MAPKDKNLLETLNLLVLLYRARKQSHPKLSEEEHAKLLVTEEHIQQSGLALPVFLNTLHTLSDKGYLLYASPFSKKMREEIAAYQKGDEFSKAMTALAARDTTEINSKLRKAIAEDLGKIVPKHFSVDLEEVVTGDEITIENLLRGANDHILTFTPDTIATVMLVPFRSIERLLEKMNSGMKFDEVQDTDIWYDSQRYLFHFGQATISTASRGSATLAHDVLDTLFNAKLGEYVVDYSDVRGFVEIKEKRTANKRYSDTMRHFIGKNPELKAVFRVLSDRVEITEKYRDDIH